MDELGKIKLFNADCMDIMRQYPDKYFELAVVDPPYSDPNGDISGGKRLGGRFDKYKKDKKETQNKTQESFLKSQEQKTGCWEQKQSAPCTQHPPRGGQTT